ncbi:GDP-mannose transporter GONST2-like [Amaranthus tricolor]|uniref:GDP-mannose transporter GONST2-like n=1 Tax=Amaranthus tricolor TaxID=29722 RepID=UPI002585D126|nr:GDP-mannose transporter GONST2-like [Amaranthus tricolor]XP_057548441.1 GDP-mannose transporter GONST2-like [Amaranthus tricolor]XP_057548442.1 GDP-mannose transporter GONST2-like [Amaranthus tricolor]XP_057548443.1 GDP-mannose transporter GONST2-like [Amaranthus tricolor]
MSSEIKLDIGNSYEHYESEAGLLDGKNNMSVAVNGIYNTIDDYHQGKKSISDITSPRERRSSSERFLRPNRTILNSIANHVVHEEKDREYKSGKKPSGPLVSGAAYCLSSCSMILLNKVVLSTYNFNAGISLMFYQNLISTIIVVALSICGFISVEKLNWNLIRVWMPVNIIFVGMLVSGMYSLKHINVAMVTILKNVTNIMTAIGDYYLFRRAQNRKVWTAMFLMIISAVSGGITDLSFDATGYAWQIMNCVLTASYSLTLRMAMEKAKQLTKSGSLNEVSMVLLNNLLSLPFAMILIVIFDEWSYVTNTNVVTEPMFWAVATLSGLLGLAISFTSMWFLGQSSPTTYSLVGSLNKIPISLAGIVLFNVPVSVPNLFSILFGLFAGVFFARAKMS